MTHLRKSGDHPFDQIDLDQLYDEMVEVIENKDPTMVAHACINLAFALYAKGNATHEQAMTVCEALADAFLKREN